LALRGITVRNRIVISPMCMYASENGFAADWHLVHLGSRAVGGAGIVSTEAAAVEPRGRISRLDLGIWLDARQPLHRITRRRRRAAARTFRAQGLGWPALGTPWLG
jgi:2,4-dienoyl-CoA reductase-like NADH-dependent reductase (Old Yellow Enzyme family)